MALDDLIIELYWGDVKQKLKKNEINYHAKSWQTLGWPFKNISPKIKFISSFSRRVFVSFYKLIHVKKIYENQFQICIMKKLTLNGHRDFVDKSSKWYFFIQSYNFYGPFLSNIWRIIIHSKTFFLNPEIQFFTFIKRVNKIFEHSPVS